MKLQYDRETDSLFLGLRAVAGADSEEIAEGLVVDFDAGGGVVGVNIQRASEVVELQTLESEGLPLRVAGAAVRA